MIRARMFAHVRRVSISTTLTLNGTGVSLTVAHPD